MACGYQKGKRTHIMLIDNHAIVILNPVHPRKRVHHQTSHFYRLHFQLHKIWDQRGQKTCWHLLYFVNFMKAFWYWRKNDMSVNIYFKKSFPLPRSKPDSAIYRQPLIKGTSTTWLLLVMLDRAVWKVDCRAALLAWWLKS